MSKIYVIGVGMTKFEKPGSREEFDYPDMAKEAGEKALKDAGISYDKVERAFVGYVYGDSCSGQRAVYQLGLTGIPIVNVNNNCATGSSALILAKNAIETGHVDCVLALGFEKMERGSLKSSQFEDRSNPLEKHVEVMSELHELTASPMTAQMFGNAGRDYLKKYNFKEDDDVFARIAHKNHKHSVNNPYAQFRKEYTLDEVKSSKEIYSPLTKLQCSPTSDGSAAAILASESFVKKHNLQAKAVEVLALEMATDLKTTFQETDCMKICGYDVTQLAARKAFEKSGITPQNVQVVELHDCFSCNELITYEALGLCPPGKAVDLVKNNDNTYGGKYVINPSGGLISKGHPLGATGIAQCSEICWQLRGEADKRQVANVKHGLTHNIGLGSAAVVGIYKLGFLNTSAPTVSVPAQGSSFKTVTSQHKSGKFFEEIEAKLKEDSSLVNKVKAVIGFDITLDNKKVIQYVVDLKNAPGSVFVNDGKTKPACTIAINDDNLAKILEGKLNMMTAFTQKKVKITGNMGIAMKLNQVFASVASAKKPATVEKPTAEQSTLTKTTTTHKSGKLFEDIEAKLKQDPSLVTKVNAVIGFEVACDKKTISYVVDLKNKPGSVFINDGNVKPGCTISINDDDLLHILSGKLNMMTAFTKKKLKISGNMGIAMKLNQLFSSIAKTGAKL